MDINKMINMLLQNLSLNHKISFIEFRTYKDGKVYKNYKVKIDNYSKEFNSKTNLLLWLKSIL